MAEQLPPLPQPVGIFGQFIYSQSESIIVDGKGLSLSGDSFDVKWSNGAPLFRVQGTVLSFRQRKQVYDPQGNHLFTVRQRASALIHSTYIVEDAAETVLMEVKFSLKRTAPPRQAPYRLF